MTELIQYYPKSSCDCYNCLYKKYKTDNGPPTNSGVRGCCPSNYYDCFSCKLFKSDIEPKNNGNYFGLNPQTLIKNYDKSFVKFTPDETSGYDRNVFASSDPRLISVPLGGQILALDSPPINEQINLNNIYTDPKMNL